MSAASFLGISAAVYANGYDGLIYSIGFLVGWPIITFLMVFLIQRAQNTVGENEGCDADRSKEADELILRLSLVDHRESDVSVRPSGLNVEELI